MKITLQKALGHRRNLRGEGRGREGDEFPLSDATWHLAYPTPLGTGIYVDAVRKWF